MVRRWLNEAPLPKSVSLDERDGQAALSGVVGDGQAVNAAAHDEHIEGAARQLLDIALHVSMSSAARRRVARIV